MEAECGVDAEDADGHGGAGRKRGWRAAARAPRRAGGRAVGETLGEGRKRRAQAQAASVPPPREGEERKR
eukprot:6555977-Prymnesium_polylepis.1